jgi:hypothetical protein
MVKLVSLYSRYGDRWKNTDIERIQKLHDEEPTHVENKGGAYKMLPIHYAVMNGAPLVVIQRLYNLYKDGLKETHADGWLPLHMACYYDNFEATVWLKKKYPEGVTQRDKDGRTAHDLAKQYKKTKALEAFPQATPATTTPVEENEESPVEDKGKENGQAAGGEKKEEEAGEKTEEPAKPVSE